MDFDIENLRWLPCEATIAELVEGSEEFVAASTFAQAMSEAAGPLGKDGKPRLMALTAWIAHGGPPNENGDAFLDSDLEAAVQAGLATPDRPMMMDFNHGFDAIGVWTRATYAFDQKAGQNGILAEGIMFAWRYNDIADKLLAEQAREGRIQVSMACIPGGVEFTKDENGRQIALLRKPVFFTTSVLTLPAADPHASGRCSEDPAEMPEDRRKMMASVASPEWIEGGVTWTIDLAQVLASIQKEEETMNEMEKLLELVRAAMGEVASEHFDELKQMLEAAQRVPALEAEVAEAKETNKALNEHNVLAAQRIAELEPKVAELELALETANARIEAQEAELVTLREFKSTIEAEQATAAAKALREARLAQLSEPALEKLNAREEAVREQIVARWMGLSDEEWQLTVETLNIAKSEGESYEERSKREGVLATGGASDDKAEGYAFYKYVN